MKFKIKIYALFQFLSLFSVSLFLFGLILMGSFSQLKIDSDIIEEQTIDAFTFGFEDSRGIVVSLILYVLIISVISTWSLGWLVILDSERNFMDSLFLMFIIFPILSNIFCLCAQLSDKKIPHTSTKLDKEELEHEKTQIISIVSKMKNAKTINQVDKIVKETIDAKPVLKREKDKHGNVIWKRIINSRKKKTKDSESKKNKK